MKLQVMVTEEVVERLDKIAKNIGVSRSSICCMIISKALPEWEKVFWSDSSVYTSIEYEQLKIK